ncbi:MAG: response regulator [Chlamydiota bacterium]
MNKPSLTSPLKLLCIDDDKDFVNYLSFLAETFLISVETCGTLEEAKKKINNNSYDAFIVDLHLPDGSGFDLLAPIKQNKEAIIAVITGVYRDEKSFSELKEKYEIDYVFDKPIYSDRLQNLFLNLYRKREEQQSAAVENQKSILQQSDSTQKKLQELKKDYDNKIVEKITLLSQLVEAVKSDPCEKSLLELEKAAHKIGGSAGTYGYHNVTTLCKELIAQIADRLKSDNKIDQNWLASLDDFLNSLKYHYQITSTFREEYTSGSLPTSFRTALYIVDHDLTFLSILERKKEAFHLEVLSESDPNIALKKLQSSEFNPKIVLLADKFPGSKLTAYDLMEETKKKESYLPTNFGIIFTDDSLDTKMQAMSHDIKYTFHKPFSPTALLQAVSDTLATERLTGFKVLVLDDDHDICDFLEVALNSIGIEVKTIQDPERLYPTLDDFGPHLLILDVLLPKYDGLNLLRTLRSDLLYRDLGVMIITHWRNAEVEQTGLEYQADEIFYKPLDKEVFIKRVTQLGRNLLLSGRFSPANKITGLPLYNEFLKKLHLELLSKGKDQSKHLVLFEVDDFTNLILRLGKAKANDKLISIGNLLNAKAKGTMSCFFITPARFAIIVDMHDIFTVEKRVRELLNEIISRNKELTLSCCIIPLIKELKNVHELLVIAEKKLQETRDQGGNTYVKISTPEISDEIGDEKNIILIDSDTELMKLISLALKPYNVEVKTFTTGEKALHELLSYHETAPPPLVITERKLPDMDGLEILEKCQRRFQHTIPLFFLTQFTSDSDISEGLEKGAIDYIAKPFNLAILTQKILKTIYN